MPPDLTFRDDTGKTVKLGDYFGRKPMILNLVYYNCTMLCGEALAGLASAMRLVKFDVGNEFDVVTVSFDPRETPEMAAAKKIDYVKRYGRANAAAGWHFLTGQPDSINALTKTVGFQYQYDAKSNQYAHATAIMVLTPQGRISRYFYGVDFPPKDLRMGLVEASQGKIGNAVDAVLLYCYHYNPETGKVWSDGGEHSALGGGRDHSPARRFDFHLLCDLDRSVDQEDGSKDKVCSIIFHYGRSRPPPWRPTWMLSIFSCSSSPG